MEYKVFFITVRRPREFVQAKAIQTTQQVLGFCMLADIFFGIGAACCRVDSPAKYARFLVSDCPVLGDTISDLNREASGLHPLISKTIKRFVELVF